jgi:enoyl-CoA hydratase
MTSLLAEYADGVAVLTLNRPAQRNALDSELSGRLRETLLDCDRRDDVQVIVLTGADPAFCAGLDLNELGRSGENMIPAGSVEGIGPVPPLGKPLIGAINGPAVTGGLELALLCDVLIASERARFADTHARVGLLPDWGLTATLPQAVGARRATEMLLTGNFIGAEEALRFGMVNCVVEHAQLLPTARKIAADIVANDRRAVEGLLGLLRQTTRVSLHEGLAIEARVSNEWQGAGVDSAEIAERRSGVMDRNRAQL